MKILIATLLMSPMLLAASCAKNDDPVIPKISFQEYSALEGSIPQNKVIVPVTLSGVTTAEVSLTYSTLDGMAKAGSDYTAVTNAVLKFAPGETTKNIEVSVTDDSVFEFDEDFYIKIQSVTNGVLMGSKIKVTLQNDDSYTPEFDADGCITPDSYPGFTLVWSDEFTSPVINTDWWNFEKGNNGGWGNNELEVYTDSRDNSYIQNGRLNIVALKNANTGEYTSARMTTAGKKEFTYARVDIRAKMPVGQGIWPALWMLGSNISSVGWPVCGEIDIMEYLGHDKSTVYGTVHYNDNGHKKAGGQYKTTLPDSFADKFHVFTLLWSQGSMVFYVDYKMYYRVNAASIKYDAFTKPQFFIFNVAVGGDWPGSPNESTVFPQKMEVDYIRVFQPG